MQSSNTEKEPDFDALALARRWSWRKRNFRDHLKQQAEAARERYARYRQLSETTQTSERGN